MLRLLLAFCVAGGMSLALTPVAIRLAAYTKFYDHPVGYKDHIHSTPYLGGAAVVFSTALASALFALSADAFTPIILGAFAMLALGSVDDRISLEPLPRMLIEMCAAAALYASGIGWSIFPDDALNLAMTIIFVTGVVNAYNLMDNMDGAAGTVAAVSGAMLGVLSTADGNTGVGVISFALSGACVGFLRYNLASPSRIFLGDGGSMPIGFIISGVIMSLGGSDHLGWSLIPMSVVFVGLPAFDTTLVVVSRLRRGVSVFTGGRDHLTHRLCSRLGSAGRVALMLAGLQAAICGASLLLFETDKGAAALGSGLLIVIGIAVVAYLESAGWVQSTKEFTA